MEWTLEPVHTGILQVLMRMPVLIRRPSSTGPMRMYVVVST